MPPTRFCVYAIVPAQSKRIRTRGSRGEVLQTLRVGRLAAVVGEQRTRPRESPRAIASYHATVERLAREVPALVPSRFGTTFSSQDELRFVLSHRSETFLRILRLVRQRWQMTVRLILAADAMPRPVVVDRESGAAYLRSRAARAAAGSRLPAVAVVRQLAARWVRAERIEMQGRMVSVYHLVPRSQVDAYRRALVERGGVPVLVSGPFAPYAFAETFA